MYILIIHKLLCLLFCRVTNICSTRPPHLSFFIKIQAFPYSYSFWGCSCFIIHSPIFKFGISRCDRETLTELNLGNRFFVHMSLMTNKFVLRVQNFLLMLVSIPNCFLLFLLVFERKVCNLQGSKLKKF